MPLKYHMPKLLNMYQWGENANIYDTFELTGISPMTRSAVHDIIMMLITNNNDNAAQLHYLI